MNNKDDLKKDKEKKDTMFFWLCACMFIVFWFVSAFGYLHWKDVRDMYSNGGDFLLVFFIFPLLSFGLASGIYKLGSTIIEKIYNSKINGTESKYKKSLKLKLILTCLICLFVFVGTKSISTISKINSLGTISLDSKDKINEIDKEINVLNKITILNYSKFESAKSSYQQLVLDEAKKIDSQIESIGEVNKHSHTLEKKISDARYSYKYANSEVQDNITKLAILENAESRFEILEKNSYVSCSNCNGTGSVKCWNCKGNKNVRYYYGGSALEAYLSGHDDYTYGPCSSCDGTGENDCGDCKGKGGTYIWAD